ncbi:MAG: hypothetical protein KC619_07810, partial [Myxococcales bacterium]|nr:hypothetical protein [Myxococcales bacterium]
MTRAALLVSLLWLAAVPAAAQGLEVAIETPSQLRQGDRTEIVARVMGSDGLPVLVTPSSEGTAVEVVRGRLMRTDATDPAAAVLELRIPIVAREAGTAVLRVRVSGYACEARCRAVSAETSVVIQVASAAARRPGEGKKQARTSSLSWVRLEGAEGCIASAALAQAVEARLARDVFVSAADAGLAVEGRVERDGEIWRAHIEVVDAAGTSLGERSLESAEASCDQLGELATVTIALMIDPLTAPEPAPAPDPEPEPQEDPPPDPEP